jgi:hypothetical protein
MGTITSSDYGIPLDGYPDAANGPLAAVVPHMAFVRQSKAAPTQIVV